MTKISHAMAIFRLYKNPWLRYLDYLKVLPAGRKYRMRLRNGLELYVRAGTSDFHVIDEIFIHKVYDRALVGIREGDYVIDIGAHSGVFAMAASLRGASVLCFEPLLDNLNLLQENIRLNGYSDRVRAYRLCVAGTPGEKTLYTVMGDTGGGTLFPSVHSQWSRWSNPQVWKPLKVECITLDDVLDNRVSRCDLLKMDCEGAEEDILEHVSEDNLRKINSIVMEYHAGIDVDRICKKLERAGFTVEVSSKTYILFASMDRSL